jgi:hypothetical protein
VDHDGRADEADRTGNRRSRRPPWVLRARRFRVAAGIVLVLALALRSFYLSLLTVGGWLCFGPTDNDPVRLIERRLRGVEERLPPRGVVGYRASGPLKVGSNHELEGDDRSIARYVVAQYVLAPRILDFDRACPHVIRDDLDPVRVMVYPER